MRKKIAVLIRERREEALRMAVGLTLANDEITVFFMSGLPEKNDDTVMSLQALQDLGARIYAGVRDAEFPFRDKAEIAGSLSAYDTVIPY